MCNVVVVLLLLLLLYADVAENECLTQDVRCEQICVDTPDSYFCMCRSGYRIEPANFNCPGQILRPHKKPSYRREIARCSVSSGNFVTDIESINILPSSSYRNLIKRLYEIYVVHVRCPFNFF